jgi:hypothetical protein
LGAPAAAFALTMLLIAGVFSAGQVNDLGADSFGKGFKLDLANMLRIDFQVNSFYCHNCKARPACAFANVLALAYEYFAHLNLLNTTAFYIL